MNLKRNSGNWKPGRQPEPFLRAFSLVEVAVVVVLVGALAGLLLIAQSRARIRALEADCLQNVRHLTMAHFMYLADTPRLIPERPKISRYSSELLWPVYLGEAYLPDQTVLFCPSAPKQPRGTGPGNAETAWRLGAREVPVAACYAINGWFYSGLRMESVAIEKQFDSLEDVRFPENTPVFGDAIWFNAWPEEGDRSPKDIYSGGSANGMMGAFAIARHGIRNPAMLPRDIGDRKLPGAVVIGFADQHARVVPLEKLWSLDWHRTWAAPEKRPR